VFGERAHPVRRHLDESFWPAASRHVRFTRARDDVALFFEPIQRHVERTALNPAARSLFELSDELGTVGRPEPQRDGEDEVLELSEWRAVRHGSNPCVADNTTL